MIFARRAAVVVAVLIVCGICAHAQDAETAPEKLRTHYLGIQVNPLLRQLLSFGSTGAVNNPYVIAWSFNSTQTGWGLGAGLGYVYNQVRSGDVISQTNTTINDFHFRFGPEKKSRIGKRWITSVGADIVSDSERNKTVSSSQGSPPFTTQTNTGKVGFGFRCTINYEFSERMMLGTEASYYFKVINEERKFSGAQPVSPSSSNLKSFTPTLPAVIYLIMKF